MRSTIPALLLLAAAGCHPSSSSEPGSGRPLPIAVNLSLSAERLVGSGALRLVGASEEREGRDLDGDGDAGDVVLQILDLETTSVANTGLALVSDRRPPFDNNFPRLWHACNDALGVITVSEEETGRDADQDGIDGELSSWTFDVRTGALHSLPFAHSAFVLGADLAAFLTDDLSGTSLRVFDAGDGSLVTPSTGPSVLFGVRDRIVAFTRAEEGVADLNADGDTSDPFVLQLYDADARRVVNVALDVWPTGLRFARGFVGFNVSEADQGGLDLDGDGDAEDVVFVAVDARRGVTRIPGITGAAFADSLAPGSESFLLAVTEADRDLDGDGDRLDSIAMLYDPRTDRIRDTGLAMAPLREPVQVGRWVGVTVDERGQGGLDLDGDGRSESTVPHVFDTLSGRSLNLGFRGHWIGALETQLLALRTVVVGDAAPENELVAWDTRSHRLLDTGADVVRVHGSLGDRALVSVAETSGDRNGDGDLDDAVLAVYDGRTGALHDLGLAALASAGPFDPQGRAAVLVPEVQQGKDLDGDGDQDDLVLHEILLDPPQE